MLGAFEMESALDRVARLTETMVSRLPFYGVLATGLVPVVRTDIETGATDGIHLFINPAYIDGLTDPKCIGFLAHEASHCALRHFDRLQWRELELANIAADYEINGRLVQAGIELPDDVYVDARFFDMSFECIYDILDRERNPQPKPQPKPDNGQAPAGQQGQSMPQPGQGKPDANGKPQPGPQGAAQAPGNPQPGNGQGQAPAQAPGQSPAPAQGNGQAGQAGSAPGQAPAVSAAPDPGKSGGFVLPQPGPDGKPVNLGELAAHWETMARQAAMVEIRNSGDSAGHAKSIIQELDRPRVDWQSILAEFVTDRIAQDYSFRRPNRRFLHSGFVFPSLVPDGIGELVLFGDSSGSMDLRAWRAILGNVQSMLDSGMIARVHMVQGDTRLQHARTYETGESIDPQTYGGGGTDFRDCMAHIAETYPDAAACIAFTDMEVRRERIGDDPGIPVLWAIWGPANLYRERAARCPFGEAMPMPSGGR
jgi:predicted metal-dependent peptidase